MQSQPDLYHYILARRSVRRYDEEPLDEATLAQVGQILSSVKALVPDNEFETILCDVGEGEDLVRDLGGYGRIVTPPHYLVPYVVGNEHVLEDLGYRVQQIAVHFAALGLGSCYIGALKRENVVRARFTLPDDCRIAAFLIFGRLSRTLVGRTLNRLIRAVAGATRKHPHQRIFFQDTFDKPAFPPPDVAPLIEAARHAPSAGNAQPWRFLWHDKRLYLFVTRKDLRSARGPEEHYCLHDGGIAMANVTMAMQALGMGGQSRIVRGMEPHVPEHPADLHPMATLLIKPSSWQTDRPTLARTTQPPLH